jgi:NAD(P)H-dependent FMN reductase
MTPKILVFAGSIRTGAYSGRTADAAMKELALQGADVTRISLADYPLPIFDADLERESGIPENAMRLGRLIAAHDGLLIASPEYNTSIPPLLKNTIDWVSRIRKDGGREFSPFRGRIAGLCSSSNGRFAGIRALNHLRPVLVAVGVEVISPQCAIALGEEAFDEHGAIRDPRTRKIMENLCRTLCQQAALLSVRWEA